MSALLHVIVYIPVTMVIGALAYRYRTQIIEAKNRIAERLKAVR